MRFCLEKPLSKSTVDTGRTNILLPINPTTGKSSKCLMPNCARSLTVDKPVLLPECRTNSWKPTTYTTLACLEKVYHNGYSFLGRRICGGYERWVKKRTHSRYDLAISLTYNPIPQVYNDSWHKLLTSWNGLISLFRTIPNGVTFKLKSTKSRRIQWWRRGGLLKERGQNSAICRISQSLKYRNSRIQKRIDRGKVNVRSLKLFAEEA